MKINDKNIFIYLLLTFVIAGCASEDPDPDAVNDDEIDFATGLFDPENLIDGDFMVVPEALEDVNIHVLSSYERMSLIPIPYSLTAHILFPDFPIRKVMTPLN